MLPFWTEWRDITYKYVSCITTSDIAHFDLSILKHFFGNHLSIIQNIFNDLNLTWLLIHVRIFGISDFLSFDHLKCRKLLRTEVNYQLWQWKCFQTLTHIKNTRSISIWIWWKVRKSHLCVVFKRFEQIVFCVRNNVVDFLFKKKQKQNSFTACSLKMCKI